MRAFGLLTLALLAVSGYTAINAVVKAELFPANVRALGVAFPYAIARCRSSAARRSISRCGSRTWGARPGSLRT
ncbi:MAG: hypothetical protein U5K74_00855 [Gemmatimonadaceae bacterium]|nr:hypothetical protein [Gemmatimonadaceae bacterium]